MFLLMLLLFSSSIVFAQKNKKQRKKDKKVKWGIKAGMSTSDIKANDLFIPDASAKNRYQLNVKDAQYGINIGMFMQVKTGKNFFIRPELHINSTRTDYEIQDLRTITPIKETVLESYHNISMPVNFGVKLGPLRLQGGAIGNYHIAGKSDLKSYEGYAQNFNGLDLGWQVGIGLDIWKFNIDWKYEGDFNNYGDHMEFFDQNIAFDQNEKQMKFAVGWTF